MSSPLPKLSYVLLSHNREKYIRAAIESAFAQDYEGELEYIFSDDCSTDRTFEIIKECVAAYKGNRRVVVTQTPRNLHLAGNTNHAVQFVESDWVVRADDDDYSAVDRCSIIGAAIVAHPRARFVTTGLRCFTDDEDKDAFSLSLSPHGAHPEYSETDICKHSIEKTAFRPGAESYKTWHMDVFRQFGALPLQGYYVDDLTCFYRASVLGTGVHINNYAAVYIRTGCSNMSRGGDANQRGYAAIIQLEKFNDRYFNITFEPMLAVYIALTKYVKEYAMHEAAAFIAELERDIQERDMLRTFWRKGILNRARITRKLKYKGVFNIIRCMPMPVFAAICSVVKLLKQALQRKVW